MHKDDKTVGKIRHQLLRTLNFVTEGSDAPLARSLRAAAVDFHQAARIWAEAPGVQGFGIGARVTAGRRTRDLALKVYVAQKLPLARCEAPIPSRLTVPGAHGPVPVDVVAIGRLSLQLHTGRARPLRPGISVGTPGGVTGTLGCLVRRRGAPGDIGVLGSAHVLADDAQAGAPLLQPGEQDGGALPDDQIATLRGWVPLKFSRVGYPNRVDAAFGELAIDPQRPGEFDVELLPPAVGKTVRRGMRVRKIGRTTDETTAIVRDVDFRFAVRLPGDDRRVRRIGFRDQILCSCFSGPGDSGAAVLDESGAIVGMHIAGADSASVFSRIGSVCDALDVDVITQTR